MPTNYYKPGDSITLYVASTEQQITGSLSFVEKTTTISVFPYRTLAFFCLFLASISFSLALLPIVIAHFRFQKQQNNVVIVSEHRQSIIPPAFTPTPSPAQNSESSSAIYNFRISIPKINVDAPIIANVDPDSESVYKDALLHGIAHAKGSYLPGQSGPILLFSHSTDSVFDITSYNAQFYAINQLQPGDKVDIFYKGNKYTYQVTHQQIISASDLDVLRQTKENLILQTCWPLGTDWERLLVYADLKQNPVDNSLQTN